MGRACSGSDAVEERLTDGVVLIVTRAWEGEEFAFKIRQPIGPFGQKNGIKLTRELAT
jgi:hypothetical protein